MTGRRLRTIQELIEGLEWRNEQQYADIARAFEEAEFDRDQDARREGEYSEEIKAEVADLGWALEETGEGIRQGFLRLDHHLDRVHGELAAELERVWGLLEEGPHAKAGREYRERGERASSNGWVDEALENFHKAEAEDYEDFSVHSRLAVLYAELGNDAKAIEYFEKTAKYARPHSRDIAADALVAAASLRERQGNLDDAYKYAREARGLNPERRKIARRVAYVFARLAVRTDRTSEALSALRRLFEIAPRMSRWVPGKAVFAPIRSRILQLLDELKAGGEARVRSLLERIRTLRAEIAALLGEKGGDLTREVDAAVNRVRDLLGGPRYSDAVDAERLARRTLTDTWAVLAQACDLRLNEYRGNEVKLSAEIEDARREAREGYFGRGFLVYWVSTFPYLVLWGAIALAIEAATQQPRMMANLLGVILMLTAGSAIVTGWLTTRWFRWRARERSLAMARELESLRNEIEILTAKKARAVKQEDVESDPAKPGPHATEDRETVE